MIAASVRVTSARQCVAVRSAAQAHASPHLRLVDAAAVGELVGEFA
jgi:hypothetical protein